MNLKIVLVACLGAVIVMGLNIPVSTRQGINYHVTARKIPLYEKALGFVQRDAAYRALAEQITKDLDSDRERILAVFEWTRENIQPTPRGWTIFDDHILNIIIRGHGVTDQIADVFSTLSTYAGVPAFWTILRSPGEPTGLHVSLAHVDGQWIPFDVWRGIVFTDEQGEFMSAEQLAEQPRLARTAVGDLRLGIARYETYFSDPTLLEVPRPLRAELQMPGPRLWNVVKRTLIRERS